MNKKFIAFFTIIAVGFYAAKTYTKTVQVPLPKQHEKLETNPEVLGKPSAIREVNTFDLKLNGGVVRAVSLEIADPENLTLHDNLTEKLTAEKAYQKKDCEFLTNAGFYTRENTPIGLLVINNNVINPPKKSLLFNGVLSINSLGTPFITKVQQLPGTVFAVQAGPVLIENGRYQTISSKNKKRARRLVVIVTGENNLVFATFYDPGSVFVGPTLSEVPMLLAMLEKEINLQFADALNLDGGTASAFYSESFSLPEASTVGGYFCLRKQPARHTRKRKFILFDF